MSNYLNEPELEYVLALTRSLNDFPVVADVSVDVIVTDANGETLGRVTITDGGEYGFYPAEDNG